MFPQSENSSMHNVRKIVSIICLVVVFAHQTYAQEFSENKVKVAAGFELLEDDIFFGNGFVTILGYQWKLKDWLFLTPQLKHGTFSTIGITCVSNQYFNSVGMGLGLNANFLKVLCTGLGWEVNYLHGLLGKNYPEYDRNFCFDLYASAGFHIAPKDKRYAINILPFSLSFGTSNYINYGVRVEMEIKLKE